jgi:SAM-dependent methyltransferase
MVGFDRWYQAVGRSGSGYRRLLEYVFGDGQFIGQQGFATREQILGLAGAALRNSEGPLLDVCCGAGGPADCISQTFGMRVVGLDLSLPGLGLSRVEAVVGDAVRLPFLQQSFGAALVLDSLASIQAPEALFAELARILRPGGGLAFTVEVGPPLSPAEQAGFRRTSPPTVMQDVALRKCLRAAGFVVDQVTDHTCSAAAVASQLATGLACQREALAKELGDQAVDDLSATLGCLADLLATRRIAEVAVVAHRDPG